MLRLHYKKTAYIAAILFVLGIIAISNSSNLNNIAPSYGQPLISQEYAPYEQLSIDQIIDDEDYIYLLLGNHDGIVQIFDHEGNHILSAAFYKHMNGAFQIAAQDGWFYVRDQHFNVYIFQDAKFSSFSKKEESSNILENVDFYRNSTNYEVHWESVRRVTDHVQVITRPAKTIFLNREFLLYISIAFVFLAGFIKYFGKKAETK